MMIAVAVLLLAVLGVLVYVVDRIEDGLRPARPQVPRHARGRLLRLVQAANRSSADHAAAEAATQIGLGDALEASLVAEAAVDRLREKQAPRVIGPVTVFRRAS
ncbi:hypothetical protein ACIGDI_34235 [Streptomyces sp. NPDC085900]|uniref:hypothetical protein n=1 Tax=Streptomyces sp. NPDC085900 TaxID=3365737 RepID=UPI0037CFA500